MLERPKGLSGEPSYRRIVRLLEDKIRSGAYPPGHKLPPERELCELFGVSRITARRSLSELTQRKLVVRHQGQGTFVTRAAIESSLLGFFSISEALKADGRLVSTRVVSNVVTTADPSEAIALGCTDDASVVRIVRVRFVDGEPYALETSALRSARFPGLESHDLGSQSLYAVLARAYDTRLVHARETLAPVMPTAEQAALLRTGADQPALRLSRTTFDTLDTATEASNALIRGDRCQLLFELWADQVASGSGHKRAETDGSRP